MLVTLTRWLVPGFGARKRRRRVALDLEQLEHRQLLSTSPIIQTVAGSGLTLTTSIIGASGPATAASLNQPTGVVVDSHGDVFIADTNHNAIRELLPNGTLVTIAGGTVSGDFFGDNGPASNAGLNSPHGLALDSQGDLFIADTGNDVIREIIATNGTITGASTIITYAGVPRSPGNGGSTTPTSFKLNQPEGVVVDSRFGNLWIADTGNNQIEEVIPGGTIGIFSNSSGLGFNHPTGLGADTHGHVFVADTNNNVIREITSNDQNPGDGGTVIVFAGTPTVAGYSGDNGPATSARLSHPQGVTVDSQGDVFIADTNNHIIREVLPNGTIVTYAGTPTVSGFSGDGGPATSAKLSSPAGVTVDSQGDLFLADTGNNRVREVFTPVVPPVITPPVSSPPVTTTHPPQILSFVPPTTVEERPGPRVPHVTLGVVGVNFAADSIVFFDGQPLLTLFRNGTRLDVPAFLEQLKHPRKVWVLLPPNRHHPHGRLVKVRLPVFEEGLGQVVVGRFSSLVWFRGLPLWSSIVSAIQAGTPAKFYDVGEAGPDKVPGGF